MGSSKEFLRNAVLWGIEIYVVSTKEENIFKRKVSLHLKKSNYKLNINSLLLFDSIFEIES